MKCAPQTPRVRVYRQGGGECTLVTLPGQDGGLFHVLFDCGTAATAPQAERDISAVASDIKAVTNGHLSAVVITRENWSRVSGFLQARRIFDGFTIDELWLNPAQNMADAHQRSVRLRRRQMLRGMRVIAGRLESEDASLAKEIHSNLDRTCGPRGSFTGDAMDYLADHRSIPRIRYLSRGQAARQYADNQLRVHVLGPGNEHRGHDAQDPSPAIQLSHELGTSLGVLGAAGTLGPENSEVVEQAQAFNPRLRIDVERARANSFFRQRYFRATDVWRRIDVDWMGVVAPLAVMFDTQAKISGVSVALELTAEGKILVFADHAALTGLTGDEKPGPCDQGQQHLRQLLERTTLFKCTDELTDIGALHRGRLSELFGDAELIALVCAEAASHNESSALAAPTLWDWITELARGRVLSGTRELPSRPERIRECEWQSFLQNIGSDEARLYYECRL